MITVKISAFALLPGATVPENLATYHIAALSLGTTI
jgi:hypothetical protein